MSVTKLDVLSLTLAESPVTFTVPLQDTVVEVEEEVTMSCEVSKPDAKVKWLKNEKPIRADKKTKITAEGKVHKMTLPKSALDDTAKYTVKLGDEVTSGNLTVKGECSFHSGMWTTCMCKC